MFGRPDGIAIDEAGDVYVVDSGYPRIQKFTSAGEFILAWGSGGSGDGQFGFLRGIAVDNGFVYVPDPSNSRIQRFTSSGAYVSQWSDIGGLGGATHIEADSEGNLYLADQRTRRVYKFSSEGQLLCEVGRPGSVPYAADGEFTYPYGVAVDALGNVYISEPGGFFDSPTPCIQKFAPDDITPVKASTWGKLKSIYR